MRNLEPKKIRAPLAVAVLAALLISAPQTLGKGGVLTGILTVRPQVLKKGQKTTATATECRSGVIEGESYTGSVDFEFVAPSRPIHIPHYTVRTNAAGKASKTKRLKAVGVWEVVAYCQRTYGKHPPEIADEYSPRFVHVLRRH